MDESLRVAVPELVMFAGLIDAVRLVEELDTERWTVPANRFRAVTLIVAVLGLPAVIVTPVGAATVKSGAPGGRDET